MRLRSISLFCIDGEMEDGSRLSRYDRNMAWRDSLQMLHRVTNRCRWENALSPTPIERSLRVVEAGASTTGVNIDPNGSSGLN